MHYSFFLPRWTLSKNTISQKIHVIWQYVNLSKKRRWSNKDEFFFYFHLFLHPSDLKYTSLRCVEFCLSLHLDLSYVQWAHFLESSLIKTTFPTFMSLMWLCLGCWLRIRNMSYISLPHFLSEFRIPVLAEFSLNYRYIKYRPCLKVRMQSPSYSSRPLSWGMLYMPNATIDFSVFVDFQIS